ncbi:TPA: hypothetical protein L4942_001233 [Pseudomonas aeruginosa]|nr:hypothetical protein [Pseudomonas aeruginosa]ETV22933.1 hypothetical protein Q048_04897 [Pseudomonas aeruginosa BWHPSA043]EJN6721467.1 hypothetical protein [Pseudomonas aeruginosa]ELP1385639.1 hypothetical protein [Pseudomonas aeruginosa]KHE33495.1 hypothetical protein LH31_18580 [Pseudomonas aeruginosa]MBW6173773.1 hypothetical protein [Pseudomonas aeruginosa]
MSSKQIECDSELLASLRQATPEELDVLVDVITDYARGRAGLDADDKKALVQAKHASGCEGYSENQLKLLGHELQQFGGHSVMNLARRLFGKSAIPYAEIVNDVYRKLNGGQAEQKSVADKEREIALALFGESWQELPPKERFERSTSVKVLSGLFILKEALSVGRPGAVVGLSTANSAALFAIASTGLRLNPLGLATTAGLSINSAVAEAYRVTVPFVAQMGWIRLRREATAADQPAQPEAQPLADEESGASDLVLHDENGGTLMKLSVIERAPAKTGHAMSPEQVSTLNPLLTNVPGLTALAELHRSNYVVCSLPFESLTKSASDDGSVRGFVTKGGKIAEHANFSTPDGLQNVLVSGAVWSALSSAVAQKHLHDINEKLTAIKRQLDALQKDMENQRWDKLAGLVDYMQSLLDHFPQEGITEHALTTLEMRQSALVELAQFFELKIREELKHAEDVEADKVLGAEGARKALQESLSRMNNWIRGYLQVAQLRVVSCALRHKAQPLERYRSDATKALDSVSHLSARATESRKIYGSQMELTNSMVFTLEESQRERFTTSLDALSNALTTGPQDTCRLHRMLFDQGERQVLLQFEDGRFTKGQLLDPAI